MLSTVHYCIGRCLPFTLSFLLMFLFCCILCLLVLNFFFILFCHFKSIKCCICFLFYQYFCFLKDIMNKAKRKNHSLLVWNNILILSWWSPEREQNKFVKNNSFHLTYILFIFFDLFMNKTLCCTLQEIFPKQVFINIFIRIDVMNWKSHCTAVYI